MKEWWRRVRPNIVSGFMYNFVRLTGRTLRVQAINYEKVQALECGKIVCGWHGKSFVATAFWRGHGVWVIISQSRDGEIQNAIFKRLGFQIIRGSTGRGGVRAAVEGIRVLKGAATMAITPDGPRGPSGVVQGGVMLMAQKSGAALIPIGISSRPRFLARSWDRYMIPMPFAKAVMIFGEPVYVPKEANEEEVEEIRLQLEAEIHRLEREAEWRIHGNTRRMGSREKRILSKYGSHVSVLEAWLERMPWGAYEAALDVLEKQISVFETRASGIQIISKANRLKMMAEHSGQDVPGLIDSYAAVDEIKTEAKAAEVAYRDALIDFSSSYPEWADLMPKNEPRPDKNPSTAMRGEGL